MADSGSGGTVVVTLLILGAVGAGIYFLGPKLMSGGGGGVDYDDADRFWNMQRKRVGKSRAINMMKGYLGDDFEEWYLNSRSALR